MQKNNWLTISSQELTNLATSLGWIPSLRMVIASFTCAPSMNSIVNSFEVLKDQYTFGAYTQSAIWGDSFRKFSKHFTLFFASIKKSSSWCQKVRNNQMYTTLDGKKAKHILGRRKHDYPSKRQLYIVV